jgi:putative ABC transport system ATP-binding protein
MKLFPGMTAYVDIPVASANNVIKVPNGALRFKPSLPAEEIARLYQENGIKAGAPRAEAGGQQAAGSSEGVRRWQQRQQQQQQRQQQQQAEETPGGGAPAKPEMREAAPDVAVVWKLLPDKSIAPVQVCVETRVHALRGVTLDIERGEFVAIMGASGSGKSTFMNVLGCLDRPSSGHYFLDGVDVTQYSKVELAAIRNRKIGFVFQGFNLLSRTTALENVELPTIYARVSKEERASRALDTLKLVGLGDRVEHFPSQLSGGQQQRVAIARALVNRPAILLADEPTGNLDSRTSVEIMEVLQVLNDQGLTIVLVTHEVDISRYAKREVVFRDGKIRRDAPVLDRPSAAEVLKTMPLLED